MSYRRSQPLERWLGPRASTVAVLAVAHGQARRRATARRSAATEQPLAHAYILALVSEFQGFARDLHDLTVERLVASSGAAPTYAGLLVEAMTGGRGLDRSNPTHATIKNDFARVGLSPFNVAMHDRRWSTTDSAAFDDLIMLRNALGHGDSQKLQRLVSNGRVADSLPWARRQLPVLNRYASAMDHLAWDHLKRVTGRDPSR